MNQAMALGSRLITRRTIPGMSIRDFDGWYTADAGVIRVGNSMSEWKNNVPGGPSLTQTDADERPSLATVNGLTALEFDGDTSGKSVNADNASDSDELLMDGIGTGDFYIAFVIATDSTSDSMVLFSKGINSGSSLGSQFNCNYGSNRFSIGVGGSSLAQTAGGQLVVGQTTLVEYHRLNGTLQIFNNGTSVASVSDSTDITHTGPVVIGATIRNNRFPFNGQICEFICNAGTVTVKNRQIIEALMARKWNIGTGLTGLASRDRGGINVLPAGNRFRNTIPTF